MTTVNDQFAAIALARLWAGNATQLQQEDFPDLHPETVHHHLQALGLLAHRHRMAPYLTYKHKKACHIWAEDHAHWDALHWAHVIFSDESKFNLLSSDGLEYVWRKPGQAYNACYTQKVVAHSRGM